MVCAQAQPPKTHGTASASGSDSVSELDKVFVSVYPDRMTVGMAITLYQNNKKMVMWSGFLPTVMQVISESL